jgi:hypothetical protein
LGSVPAGESKSGRSGGRKSAERSTGCVRVTPLMPAVRRQPSHTTPHITAFASDEPQKTPHRSPPASCGSETTLLVLWRSRRPVFAPRRFVPKVRRGGTPSHGPSPMTLADRLPPEILQRCKLVPWRWRQSWAFRPQPRNLVVKQNSGRGFEPSAPV